VCDNIVANRQIANEIGRKNACAKALDSWPGHSDVEAWPIAGFGLLAAP
jgi:hypothetical protein